MHQNASKRRKNYMRASVYIQFWRYFKNYFYFFDSIVYYKACEHMCNVLGKYVIQFPIYGLRVKWARPGSRYTWGTRSNRVKPHFFSNQNMPVLEPKAVKTNLILPGSKRCSPSCQKWSNSIILLLINIKPCLSQLRNNQLLPLQIKWMILLHHL